MEAILSYCFPSTIFYQLIAMKAAVQSALNTQGKNKRNRVVCKIDNFGRSTWDYLKLQLALDVEASPVVVKSNLIQETSWLSRSGEQFKSR